jgi:hypothetical protein
MSPPKQSRFSRTKQFLFLFLAISMSIIGIQTTANAGIVTTTDIVDAQQTKQNRERVRAWLAREDVRDILTAQGVDTAAAQGRVDSMTDAEIQSLAAKMDSMPVGAGLSNLELLLLILIIVIAV